MPYIGTRLLASSQAPTHTECGASQSATDAGMVECDAALGGVLGELRVRLSSMERRLAALLTPAPPHVLQYTIRCVPHVCMSACARARVCMCV